MTPPTDTPIAPDMATVPVLVPLFPLQTVLFPSGLLQLKVFEARYLDMVSRCLREGSSFGVVCLLQGHEVRGHDAAENRFETTGVLAHLEDVDAQQAGILQVRCRGGQRFSLSSPTQRDDGLWQGQATRWPAEPPVPVPDTLTGARDALRRAMDSLAAQDQHPFAKPYHLNDAGWVANRWCELLPISLAAKQKLMALDEPTLRLQLVDEFLRGKGVVG